MGVGVGENSISCI